MEVSFPSKVIYCGVGFNFKIRADQHIASNTLGRKKWLITVNRMNL